jgi:hypothetical protein
MRMSSQSYSDLRGAATKAAVSMCNMAPDEE